MTAAVLQNPIFTDETAAREWLEARVWANGVSCPHCGNADTAKIRKLDPSYSIDHDEWQIRHKSYVEALSQDVRKWIGHEIYRNPHVHQNLIANPDPDSGSGCKCWIGIGE